MADWIIFIFLILFSFLIAINAKKNKEKIPKSRVRFYFIDIIFSIIILVAIYILNPVIYKKLDFDKIGKGLPISEEWVVSAIFPIFFIPFILSLLPKHNYFFKKDVTEKGVFGYPDALLPNNVNEHLLFSVYIINGVVFEELFCRQFMFYSFFQILALKGDVLLMISSLFFAIGHSYQGWKGVLGTFIGGLLLGKIFQIEGTILYPMILHLFFNLTLSVLAFKRLRTKT